MTHTNKPMNSQADHERELARMRERWETVFKGLYSKPYTGRTDDIDIQSQRFFCPNCDYKEPLKLTNDKQGLYCCNPSMLGWCGEYCDYGYDLTQKRIREDIFWTSGFEYPVSERERLNRRLKASIAEAEKIPDERIAAMKRLDDKRDKLAKIIADTQAELIRLG